MVLKQTEIEVRDADPNDGQGVVELVHKLAAYEKLVPPDSAAVARLLDHAFGAEPKFQLLVAVRGEAVVAYAAWFLTYSTFRAQPTLYLEDLFVDPKFRRQKIGSQMMQALKERATCEGCGRFEWTVLDWNEDAQAFYKDLGAAKLSGWQGMRIDL